VSAPEDAALDALAEALAPRLLRLLRERAGVDDDALAELLDAAGFELDDDAPTTPAKVAPPRKGRAA